METFTSDRKAFQGYLALPTTETGPGILLLHAWWGLNDFFCETCEWLASQGFVCLAPDYYNGKVADTISQAEEYSQQVDRFSTNQIVKTALSFLGDHPAVSSKHIGVIGFSLGAMFAIQAARSRPGLVNAVVLFYGNGGGKFDKTNAEFLGHFAENDEFESEESVNELARRIQAGNRKTTFYYYAATQHWFAESDRLEYDEAAANLAWERTLNFLNKHFEE